MRLISKICKRILPMFVIPALLLSFNLVHGAEATTTTNKTTEAMETIGVAELKQLNIDFDLSDEISQASDILSKFTPDDPDGFYVFPDPQELAAPYIPEEAICTDVCIIGHVVSIDYRIGNVRYIAAYCNDGTVRMTSSVLADEVSYVYEISSDSPTTVRCTDCEKNVIVWEKETTTQSLEAAVETRASVKEAGNIGY